MAFCRYLFKEDCAGSEGRVLDGRLKGRDGAGHWG
jgi:hypothetical protein